MKRTAVILSSIAVAALATLTFAQGHEREHEKGQVVVKPPPRAAPPAWKAHQPGPHPHGPIVRSHQVRVLAPKVFVHGAREGGWHHWEHAEFARPHYYWNWAIIHQVSCTAEDSYGDQYPVTEATTPGFGVEYMTAVEDDALDRCYSESGSDDTCYLVGCSHF